MVVFGYILIILAVYFVLLAFFPKEEKDTVSLKGEAGLRRQYKKEASLGGRFLEAFGYINVLLTKVPKINNYYRKSLDRASIDMSSAGFLSAKELFALFFVIGGILFDAGPRVLMVVFMVGFFIPDLWLSKKIAATKEGILRSLPETVDLVNLCVSAGLDFMGAVRWITQSRGKFVNPVTQELLRVREEVNLGKSKSEALLDMGRRLQINEMTSLVRSLLLSERLGIPITESLDNFSEDNRERRFHKGERKARMASIKILFPLIFFILPTIGIIIVGPIMIRFLKQGLGGIGGAF